MTSAEIWWKYVPASRKLVKGVAGDVIDRGISVQVATTLTPWREQFMQDLLECIDRYGSGLPVYAISGGELTEYRSVQEGTVHLLGCDRGYDGRLESIQNNLPEIGCIIHFSGLSPEQLRQVYPLAAELYRLSSTNRLPRVSLLFDGDDRQKRRGILNVTGYRPGNANIRYYAYRLLIEAGQDQDVDYGVALAFELSGGDLERCAAVCERIGQYGLSEPSRLTDADDADTRHAIHRAQIRVVEPLVQLGRLQMCERLSRRIDLSHILPFTDDYGNTCDEPFEMELRHLWHYRDKIGLTEAEHRILKLLYEARNDLSHQHLLHFPVIQSIDKFVNGDGSV